MIEESAGMSGHERTGNPGVGAVAESHPKAGSLLLHPAAEDAGGPPMIRSAWRRRPGPIVLANAGTKIVWLLKLVWAFYSMVKGCRRAPGRWVWAFH